MQKKKNMVVVANVRVDKSAKDKNNLLTRVMTVIIQLW